MLQGFYNNLKALLVYFFSHFCVTMVMFHVLIMWMSLIRYCQDSRLFMSTNIVCHIVCSLWRFPSSLRKVKWRLALEGCAHMNLDFNKSKTPWFNALLTQQHCSQRPYWWVEPGSRWTAQTPRCLYHSAPSTWKAASCSTERIHLLCGLWSEGR